jgi:putative DNA primase/helicase
VKDWARFYAGMGWAVFPTHTIRDGACSCGRECTSPGKHPIPFEGCKAATLDAAVIDAWWDKTPDANLAIATGSISSGLFVVDIDGPEAFDAYLDIMGVGAPTHVKTGGGGNHVYFSYPEGRNTHWKIADKIDTRGEGGYVLAPPSLHRSGKRYEWWGPEPNWSAMGQPLPEVLVELLKPRIATPPAEPKINHGSSTAYAEGIRKNALLRVRAAGEGQRNSTLNDEAFLLGQWIGGGELAPHGVAEALEAASTDPDAKKVTSTVRRALHDGLAYPRTKQ